MKKVLFLIHDLGSGGAEKVLVNLVNNLDPDTFDVTVIALFGGGVNERFLKPHVHFRAIFPRSFPGNSHFLKLFSPKTLHKWFVKDRFDIEVSYLEGPSARVISGCPDPAVKLVSWIHVQHKNVGHIASPFRSEKEMRLCYDRFDQTICVSDYVLRNFRDILHFEKPIRVLYNTVESEEILRRSAEEAPEIQKDGTVSLVAVGTLKESKGYPRLLRIIHRLRSEKYPLHLYVLGVGPLQEEMEATIREKAMTDTVTLLGYQTNPYKFVAACDLFVCASFAEGFSTAATEALIVGTPVCTVEVSGMKEMLGEQNEYGIVTENDEEALYEGIKRLLDDPTLLAHYREQAAKRGKNFSTETTTKAVEEMLLSL